MIEKFGLYVKPDGAYDYVVHGRMIGGFWLIMEKGNRIIWDVINDTRRT